MSDIKDSTQALHDDMSDTDTQSQEVSKPGRRGYKLVRACGCEQTYKMKPRLSKLSHALTTDCLKCELAKCEPLKGSKQQIAQATIIREARMSEAPTMAFYWRKITDAQSYITHADTHTYFLRFPASQAAGYSLTYRFEDHGLPASSPKSPTSVLETLAPDVWLQLSELERWRDYDACTHLHDDYEIEIEFAPTNEHAAFIFKMMR